MPKLHGGPDAAVRPKPRLTDRQFFLGMAIAVLVVCLIGFAPSYYLRGTLAPPQKLAPLTPMIIAHSWMATAWMILFVVQSYLARARFAWHRVLGIGGTVLAVVFIPISAVVILQQADRGSNIAGAPPLAFLAIPLFDLLLFALFVAIGIRNIKRPDWHKRFMLAAAAAMMSAGAARLGLPNPILVAVLGLGGPLLILGALAFWDKYSRGAVLRPTWVAIVIVFLSDVGRGVLSGLPWWHNIVAGLVEHIR